MSTPIPIDDLFTPAASGIGPNPSSTPEEGSWMAQQLSIAATVQLPTTAWQPGQPEREIMAIQAVCFSQDDVLISQMAQGGFLDYAASGTVTYTALNGETVVLQVTPDPSDPAENPNGTPGWLDVLGSSSYGVERLQATYARGALLLANTTAIAAGPFDPGSYHVANSISGATYANVNTLSVPSSIIPSTGGVVTGVASGSSTTLTTQSAHGLTVGDGVMVAGVTGVAGLTAPTFALVAAVPSATTFTIGVATSGSWISGGTVYKATVAEMVADVIGLGSNAGVGQVDTTVTTTNGVSCSNATPWSAVNYESNVDYAARCRLSLAALSPNGPSQSAEYFARTAASILLAQTPSVTLNGGAITAAISFGDPVDGTTRTIIASASPASTVLGEPVTEGVSQLPISNATNATPIVITTTAPHELIGGDFVTIAGVMGNTNANGTWSITVLTSTTFSLDTSVGNAAYTVGGTVDGGDLGQVNQVIQTRVVPDGTAAYITESALAFPVTIAATVVVPQADAATYRAALVPALTQYLKAQPIGGNVPPGGSGGTIPISAVEGVLSQIGVRVIGGTSYVRQITGLLVNGDDIDLDYPAPEYQALLAAVTVTVIGV